MRPSFFQSSLPSKPDDRAETLKKIDEIEAQMSMQWWKTKGPDSLVSTGSSLNTGAHSTGGTPLKTKDDTPAAGTAPDAVARQRKAQYDETEPAALPVAVKSPIAAAASVPHEARNPPSTQEARAEAAPAGPARTGLMAPTQPSELASANSPEEASLHRISMRSMCRKSLKIPRSKRPRSGSPTAMMPGPSKG